MTFLYKIDNSFIKELSFKLKKKHIVLCKMYFALIFSFLPRPVKILPLTSDWELLG